VNEELHVVASVMEKHTLSRVGAVCAIGGALITGIFNGMHPELAGPAGIVQHAAHSSNWTGIHWGLIFGLVVMQLGFSTFVLTLGDHAEKQWGLLGVYTQTVGLALWIVVFAAEVRLKPLADAAQTDQALLGGALALAHLVDATATAAIIVYWLGVALLGMAIWVSGRYPQWMGATGLAIGSAMTLTIGLPKALLGASAWTERMGFQSLAALFLVWTVVLGALLWRKSEEALGSTS
jgi:hypothetical protein